MELSSTLYQYPSAAAAQRAWARLLAQVARCRTSGSETDEGVTSRYVTRVGSLPALFGRTGLTIFTSSSRAAENPGSWMYTTYRTLGNAIISTRFGDEVALSKPRTTVSVEVRATAEVLVARSTQRYRNAARQTVG